MKTKILSLFFLVVGFLSGTCSAAVNFVTSSASINVSPGGTFEFDLNLEITSAEKVTGLDYYWQISAPGGGFFGLTGRAYESGQFPEVTISNAIALASPGNILNPGNSENLGAGVSDVFEPLSTGTWLVARYTFSVDPSAVPGSYTLSTFSPSGKGWVGPAPFNDFVLNQQASLSIQIIPEPQVSLLLFASLLFIAKIIGMNPGRNGLA